MTSKGLMLRWQTWLAGLLTAMAFFAGAQVINALSYQESCGGCAKETVETGDSSDDMGYVYQAGVSAYYTDYFGEGFPSLGGKKGDYYITTGIPIKTALPLPDGEDEGYVSSVSVYLNWRKVDSLDPAADCSIRSNDGQNELLCTYFFVPSEDSNYETFLDSDYSDDGYASEYWVDIIVDYELTNGQFAPSRTDEMGNYSLQGYTTAAWDRPIGYFVKDYIEAYEDFDEVQIGVKVRSDLDVDRVEFYLDGELAGSDSTGSLKQDIGFEPDSVNIFTFVWDASDLPNGDYEWQARVYSDSTRYGKVYNDYGDTTLSAYKYEEKDDESCKLLRDALGGIMQDLIERRQDELAIIELVDDKVKEFYLNNIATIGEQKELFDAIGTASDEVYQSITELIRSSSVDCDDDVDEQIDAFIANQTIVVEKMGLYADSVIALIDAISGEETTNE